jgi:trigger factor
VIHYGERTFGKTKELAELMKTELLGQEKNIVKVKVEIEPEEFTEILGETIKELSDKAKIPGFRKGHVPRRALEIRVGKKGLYAEALEKLFPKAIDQVVGDYDLKAINPPSVDLDIDSIQEGQPFTCELAFEVLPDISLPELEEVEVKRPPYPEVTDATIDDMIMKLRDHHATLSPVDRAAGEGDVVSVSYVIKILDDEEDDDDEPQLTDVELTKDLRSEFREALLGKKAEDRVETEFVIERDPEDEDEGSADKRAKIEFTVKTIQEKLLPELGSEFYKKVASAEIESEEAFREDVKKNFTQYLESKMQNYILGAAVTEVANKSEVEIPDSMLSQEMERLKERDTSEAERRFNLSLEEYLRRTSVSPDNYEQVLRTEAEKVLRQSLILDEIGEKFNISVEKEELEAEIIRLAEVHNVTPTKMMAEFYKNEERMANILREMRINKIAQFIAGKVKVVEMAPNEEQAQDQNQEQEQNHDGEETLPETPEGAK